MKIPGYHIKHQIGQGGMAMVYYAIQESLGRPVALKIMNPLLADRPEFSQRFLNEGRLLATLRHNHIMTIYDIGVSEQCHYISMEYVDGGDLKQRILHGLLPLTALDYTITLGHCLKAAHDLHVVHRDIKPVNILFRRDGTLVLTDFGVAKNLESLTELTTTGNMVGSPYYLSPEQALGRPIDGRADIYSLGIVLYEMLVGARPFQGDSAIEVAMQHINHAPPPLPPHLSYFQPLFDRMTAKDPQDRFPHVASFLTAAQELHHVALLHDASQTTDDLPQPPAGLTVSPVRAAPSLPDVSLSPDNSSLEKTVILDETEEPTSTGDTDTAVATGHTAPPPTTTLTPTKLWLLTGVVGALALAGVIAIGSLTGQPRPASPPTVSLSPPIPTTDMTQPASLLQATPTMEQARTAEGVSPEGVASPVSSGDSLVPAEHSDQGANVDQVLAQPTSTDSAPSAVALPALDSISVVDARQTAEIAQWLTAAQAALADNRLLSPPQDNAAYYYQHAQALDPTHPQVAEGWHLLAQRYYELAQQAMDKKHLAKTQQYVQTGLRFQSDHAGLLSLRDLLQHNDTRRSRQQPLSGQPSLRLTKPSSRSPEPSAKVPHRSKQGLFQGVKNLFKASPSGSQAPHRERASEPNE